MANSGLRLAQRWSASALTLAQILVKAGKPLDEQTMRYLESVVQREEQRLNAGK